MEFQFEQKNSRTSTTLHGAPSRMICLQSKIFRIVQFAAIHAYLRKVRDRCFSITVSLTGHLRLTLTPQDGNGYKIPANPRIPNPLGADLGMGLYPRVRARVRLQTRRVFANGFLNLISEPANPLTCGPKYICIYKSF